MKRYFIYAYDEIYQGANNIFETFLFEGSFKDACELGLDMSYDVISAHHSIVKTLKEKGKTIEDDMAYEVWEVREDAPPIGNFLPREYIKRFCKT